MSTPGDPKTLVPPDQAIEFDDGIPGFPGSRRFVLRDLDEVGTFQVLESLDEPEVALVVCVPWPLVPDYEFELDEEEQGVLGLQSAEDAAVLCAVTLDEAGRAFHLNLLGPFVVNARNRKGRQVVLADSGLPVRHTIHLDDLDR